MHAGVGVYDPREQVYIYTIFMHSHLIYREWGCIIFSLYVLGDLCKK